MLNRNHSSTKGRKFPPEPLTPEEVRRLLQACSSAAPTGIRNRALLVVLYRGGLRISEALALKPKDLDAKAGTVRVLHGKGDKARTVGLDVLAFEAVARWVDVRRNLGINNHAPVFCTLKGRRLSPAYVRALLPRLARKANITKRVHAHGLRHTHAAELANEGVPLHVIRKQLGHASLATTDRYLDHLAPQDVIEAMQARQWRAEA
jgi:site-specific recombinase XerD